jgi:teichuronic acid exporter
MSLKKKTINGLFWSFVDNSLNMILSFFVGIVLARTLNPSDFGLIGITTVLITIASTFVIGGFGQSLIRKQNCTLLDFSTIFYFNISIAVIIYLMLFIFAKKISIFLDNDEFESIIKFVGIGLIINSFSIIQTIVLTKELNFKLQANIAIFSTIISGAISILMAYSGFGVYSLVYKSLIGVSISTILLWKFSIWKPTFNFSYNSLKELFGFGSKVLASNLLAAVYGNIYYFIISKYFSLKELGYYTRADQFQALPSSNLQSIVSRVTYPVLATIQNEPIRLLNVYRKVIKTTMLITFTSMIGLAAISEPLILSLIGEKWSKSIVYLQILCFVGMFYPLNAINLEILQIKGRSDLYLRLEVIKKIISIPIIIIGVIFGMKSMLYGMVLHSIIAFYLNSLWSGKLIGYSFYQQCIDIFPMFIVGMLIGLIMFSIGFILILNPFLMLTIKLIIGTLVFFILCELIKLNEYFYLKNLIYSHIKGK